MRKVALLAGVLLLGAAATARGATYLVAQQDAKASDDGPGTEAAPWKTITRSLKELKAGDTVIVKKGIYREELILPRTDWNWQGAVRPAFRSGTDYAHMITLLAQPGEEVAKGRNLFWVNPLHDHVANTGDLPLLREPWPGCLVREGTVG